MEINLLFKDSSVIDSDESVFILVDDQMRLSQEGLKLDQDCTGLISNSLEDKTYFQGKYGQHKHLTHYRPEGKIRNIILIGIGDDRAIENHKIEGLGNIILKIQKSLKLPSILIPVDINLASISKQEVAAMIASGIELESYEFNKYKTNNEENTTQVKCDINILVQNTKKSKEYYNNYHSINQGVFFTKDLVNEPGNILYPGTYAELIVNEFKQLDISVEVMGEREMRANGMGAIIGVGQGSINESKIVTMVYKGDEDSQEYISLVGKGVTFDTGGISLKPPQRMEQMKYDMAGSASVVGTMKSLALRKAKVNVVGIVGLVENMPGGGAQRPGDIVTTMSGKTVEVQNTDAEGRLVLADIMWYVQEKYSPKIMIDLATLTGAIVVSLGSTYAGCFTNSDELSNDLVQAGKDVDEEIWRMPLHKDYDEMIKSISADLANIGKEGGSAGSSTAAAFLSNFVKEDVEWAHLDIAGVAWDKRKSANQIGASGFGVKLLNQFILNKENQ